MSTKKKRPKMTARNTRVTRIIISEWTPSKYVPGTGLTLSVRGVSSKAIKQRIVKMLKQWEG